MIVVDASVAVKCLVLKQALENALAYLKIREKPTAPDLVRLQCAPGAQYDNATFLASGQRSEMGVVTAGCQDP